ncbi:MAG: SIS domain-containing protein [Pseudorhodobacter sp.]
MTLIRHDIDEIPAAVEDLLVTGANDLHAAARAVRAASPALVVSVGRGHYAEVCAFLKCATALLLDVPTALVHPSVASIFQEELRLGQALCLVVSKHGQSADLVHLTHLAEMDGAITVALTNNTTSPLGLAARSTIGLQAGREQSRIATKTAITSLVAGLWLLADWKGDGELRRAIHDLPRVLEQALGCDWSELIEALDGSVVTLGNGPGHVVARAAALRLRETCQIRAESYSMDEIPGGPIAAIDGCLPMIGFAIGDKAEAEFAEYADSLAEKGAQVFVTSHLVRRAQSLDHLRSTHWLTDALPLIVSFYVLIERLCAMRGFDPDFPAVTEQDDNAQLVGGTTAFS